MMVPWTFLLLGLRWTGVRLYHIRNREQGRRFQKRVSGNCTHVMDGNLGSGYALGRFYIAHLNIHSNEYGDTYDIWVLCHSSTFEDLNRPSTSESLPEAFSDDNDPGSEDEAKPSTVVIHERLGTYCNLFFRPRTITLTRLQPRENQRRIMGGVLDFYRKYGHAVVYLHGPPGSGKSLMGLLLAKELGGSYCNTLKPWQPGDTIGELYSDVEPSEDKPLVLVFDEFDTALVQFPLSPHHKIPIAVPDKAGWNRMMDENPLGPLPLHDSAAHLESTPRVYPRFGPVVHPRGTHRCL